MNVCKARRVGNDGVSDERELGHWVRQDTRVPKAVQHVGDHSTLTANLSLYDGLEGWHQTGILDHIRHQGGRVSADRVEFQACLLHEVGEHIVRSNPYAVSMKLQFIPQSEERLDVTTTADDLDDDVQFDIEGMYGRFGSGDWGLWRGLGRRVGLVAG